MEFEEVTRRRRMVRNYSSLPVESDAVDRIVEAGVRAPAAGGAAGRHFVIITDPATRASIAGLAGEASYVARGFPAWLSGAPVHVVVCVSEAAYRERYGAADKAASSLAEGDWPVPYWWVDAGASLMAMLLAAVAEGLAAGFLGAHRLTGLHDLLGIPPAMELLGVVTIGKPAPNGHALGRRRAAAVVHRERWRAAQPHRTDPPS